MVNLLLISPKSEQAQGGMTVWTTAFTSQCSESEIKYDLLNIATIGRRAVKGNEKRSLSDEIVRTKSIFKNLKGFLKRKKYHVAHMNTSCGAFGLIRDYMIVKRIKKKQPECKRIVHFHCDVEKSTRSKYSVYFLKKLLKITDTALVLNNNNKKFLKENSNTEVIAIPNFIDSSLVRKNEKVISENVKNALFVGFVQPEKGVKEIYQLANKFPHIVFDLVGQVRADVTEWEKPQNVILHGPKSRSEIINYLDNADIFIFPTHSEGFSVALLESMARGLPSVTTTAGANSEMLEGKGGIVVSVGDVEAMEKAIVDLESSHKRKEMSDWNIEKVSREYTAQAAMKKFNEIYNKI